MKKYPKKINCDERGQLVIPKDIRLDLNIEEGTGFFMYVITNEGILLRKIDPASLEQQDDILSEIKEKADKLNMRKDNILKAVKSYEKRKEGNLELI